MTDDIEVQRRQWHLVGERLDDYKSGRIGIDSLVADLDALWHVLESAPEGLRGTLREHWWTLEQLLAVGRDRDDIAKVLSENRLVLDDAVDQLQQLVLTALGSKER